MSKKTKDPRDILIQRIKEALPTGNDVATVGEEEQIALSKNLEDELLKTEIASRLQDIGERKKYADKIFQAVRLWVWAIIAIVVAHGFLSERPPESFRFKLSDAVILALIGSTTVNIVGLFIIVANYLFPKNPN